MGRALEHPVLPVLLTALLTFIFISVAYARQKLEQPTAIFYDFPNLG